MKKILSLVLILTLVFSLTACNIGGGSGGTDSAVLGGLLHGQIGEVAGDGVIGLTLGTHQVEGDGGELGGGAALQEEDLVGVRHVESGTEIGLGILKDFVKDLRSVTHLHH